MIVNERNFTLKIHINTNTHTNRWETAFGAFEKNENENLKTKHIIEIPI